MTTATLTVEHVTKRYGSGATEVTAVRDVSLAVAPGEVVLIMGPSGSGKTTLLLMLGALLKPTEGKIRLDSLVLSALPEKDLPDIRLRQFGFVFQDFNLLSALTVLENVAIVAELAGMGRTAARNKALALLTELGLGDRLRFLPEKLSGGEKQRVAIARALVNDPALILADEPTANLDSKIGREIMRLLQRIAREQRRSVVIVSHDQRIKEIADRVLWLEDGQFKAMLEMATDPVCGMAIERDKAITAEWDGQTFFFCARGRRSEEGQPARRGHADDRHGCACRTRQIQMRQGRIVVDYVDARADRETGKLPAIVINVQGHRFALGAAREQPSVCAVQRNPAGAATAIRPLRDQRAVLQVDGDRRTVPEVRVGAPPLRVDDQGLGATLDGDHRQVDRG